MAGRQEGKAEGGKGGRRGMKAGRAEPAERLLPWTAGVASGVLGVLSFVIPLSVLILLYVGDDLQVVALHAQPQPQTPLQRLQDTIARTTKSVNATWGIYVKALEFGDEIAIDADRQMETMSTI